MPVLKYYLHNFYVHFLCMLLKERLQVPDSQKTPVTIVTGPSLTADSADARTSNTQIRLTYMMGYFTHDDMFSKKN